MGHDWRPIAPLLDDWQSWVDSELPALTVVWKDLRTSMGDEVARRLHQRMITEWSIETGMVEDLYRWDRGVTETLLAGGVRPDRIPSGASKWSSELVAQVIDDQTDVAEGLFSVGRDEGPLGTSFIHELHSQLLQSAPHDFELGKWKVLPNRVRLGDDSIHEYCPPEHVSAEMDRLLELHRAYEVAEVPVEIRAAWFHHRFTQIHPYPDGNGRVARALASLLFIKVGLFPLIIRAEEKTRYLHALEAADQGNDLPLIEHLRSMQRRELVKMAADGREVPIGKASLDEAFGRLDRKLGIPSETQSEREAFVAGSANALAEAVSLRIESLAKTLTQRYGESSGFQFKLVTKSSTAAARLGLKTSGLDYEPRFISLNKMICLQMARAEKWRIVASIHEVGPERSGIAVCVVFLSAPREEVRASISAPSDYFLITYAEPLDAIRDRFGKWLERQLIQALDLWQRLL